MVETISTIAIVLGLVELVKQLGLSSKYAPLLSLTLGVGIQFLIQDVSAASTLAGIVYGLSASGLYSGGKTTATLVKPPEDTPSS